MGTEKESSQTQPKGHAKSSCEPLLAGTLVPCPSVRRPRLCAAEAASVAQERPAGSAGCLPTRRPGQPSICERFITEST